MPRISNEYKPEITSSYLSHDNILLILSGRNHLSYAILNNNKEVVLIRNYELGVDEDILHFHRNILNQDYELTLSYQKIFLGIANKRIACVPNEYFQEEKLPSYLENTSPIWKTDILLADKVESQDIHIVYAYKASSIQSFQDFFPAVQIKNIFSAYIESVSSHAQIKNEENCTAINILENSIYIVFFKKGELIFANVYEASTIEDKLYYILLVYNEFKINTIDAPAYISGKISKHSKLYDLIYSYIGIIQFIEISEAQGSNVTKPNSHIFYDIFTLMQ